MESTRVDSNILTHFFVYSLSHMSCRMELVAMERRHVIERILDKYSRVVMVKTILVMKLGIWVRYLLYKTAVGGGNRVVKLHLWVGSLERLRITRALD